MQKRWNAGCWLISFMRRLKQWSPLGCGKYVWAGAATDTNSVQQLRFCCVTNSTAKDKLWAQPCGSRAFANCVAVCSSSMSPWKKQYCHTCRIFLGCECLTYRTSAYSSSTSHLSLSLFLFLVLLLLKLIYFPSKWEFVWARGRGWS